MKLDDCHTGTWVLSEPEHGSYGNQRGDKCYCECASSIWIYLSFRLEWRRNGYGFSFVFAFHVISPVRKEEKHANEDGGRRKNRSRRRALCG